MRIVLWGATGQAIVLAELFGRLGDEIVALFDNDPAANSPLPGVPIYRGADGFEAWLKGGDATAVSGLAAIGGDRGRDRLDIHRRFEAAGIALATAVHLSAFVATDAWIGKGSQLLAMSGVGSRVRLGEGCIVNTAASVDHECELGEGAHVGPGAHLAGNVIVGAFAFVGTGASVVPRVRIGAGSTIGAGSVVLADVEPGTVVAGNPARPLPGKR